MGVPSLNDLAVDGTLNTTNQPKLKADSSYFYRFSYWMICITGDLMTIDKLNKSQSVCVLQPAFLSLDHARFVDSSSDSDSGHESESHAFVLKKGKIRFVFCFF